MSVLPIVTYDDPVLRQESENISADSQDLQTLIDDMFETMYNGSGVGLAAPQIGKSIRLFVMDADVMTEDTDEDDLGPLVFINPEVTQKSDIQVSVEEGCLSIPGVRDSVNRPESISVKFFDRNFKSRELNVTGWSSRVIQHEIDHLDGILFIDYLGSFRKRLLKGKLMQVKITIPPNGW
ncbi:MAG: peptide deformylase [Rhodothermaceae bacterium]|nr:peptide deformylase [Rhodothermaceae bacterium]